MNATGLHLPRRVTLPDEPLIAAWHLRACLNQSKQVLHLWRARHGFPQSHREGWSWYTSTDAVRQWLEARNVRVTIQ